MTDVVRIKTFAKSKGITQTYLCEKLGLRKNYLSDVQNGKDKLSDDRLEQIAKLLGTSLEYLSGKTNDPAPAGVQLTAFEEEFLEVLRGMNEEGRQAALGAVSGLAALPQYRGERDFTSDDLSVMEEA